MSGIIIVIIMNKSKYVCLVSCDTLLLEPHGDSIIIMIRSDENVFVICCRQVLFVICCMALKAMAKFWEKHGLTPDRDSTKLPTSEHWRCFMKFSPASRS